MRQSPVSTTLDLRPIPPPEPVPMPSSHWWIWLMPAVLVSFLIYWWSRKPVVRQPSPRDLLEDAIESSGQGTNRNDVTILDLRFREFLAWRQTPAWLSTPFAEAAPLWQELLPDSAQAAVICKRFAMLEPSKYQAKNPDSEAIQLQRQAILDVLAELDEHDKLMNTAIFSQCETKND